MRYINDLGRSFMRRFHGAKSGQVAITFGLLLIPITAAIGCAIDVSRALAVKTRLTESLDAAALAIGGTLGLTNAQMTAMAQSYFYANYPAAELGTVTSLQVAADPTDDSIIRVSGTAEVETSFLGLIGVGYLDVTTTSEVVREKRGLEIALVLDNTGSMAGTKIAALKTSSNTLINILFGNNANPDLLRMSIVPFSQTVKVSTTQFLNNGWMDTLGQSSSARLNFDNGKYAFAVWPTMSSKSWGGCLEARPGGLEETDDEPSAANPNTRWVPYFRPDSPDNPPYSGYSSNYVADGITGTQDVRLRNSAKYIGKNVTTPNTDCNIQEILPLTNNKATLVNYINGMVATGMTHIAIGAGWGWRTLSPTPPYTEAQPYTNQDWTKAMVIMTDGENTTPTNSTWHKGEYTAYNLLVRNQLGTTNGAAAELRQDELTSLVCTRIKAAGIRVYTILLMEDSLRAKNLMKGCASDPSLYFESPTAAQLESVFTSVAKDLSNLRLSK